MTHLDRIKEIDKRLTRIEENMRSSLPSIIDRKLNDANERYRVRNEKNTRTILQKTHGIISKKRGKELLNELTRFRDN